MMGVGKNIPVSILHQKEERTVDADPYSTHNGTNCRETQFHISLREAVQRTAAR